VQTDEFAILSYGVGLEDVEPEGGGCYECYEGEVGGEGEGEGGHCGGGWWVVGCGWMVVDGGWWVWMNGIRV
jgi:hypothetical protein